MATAAVPVDDDDQVDDDDDQGDQVDDDDDQGDDVDQGGGGRRRRSWAPPAAIEGGAGFLLGALFWLWVGLPFLRQGPTGPRDILRAKFTNKAPDGTWLP